MDNISLIYFQPESMERGAWELQLSPNFWIKTHSFWELLSWFFIAIIWWRNNDLLKQVPPQTLSKSCIYNNEKYSLIDSSVTDLSWLIKEKVFFSNWESQTTKTPTSTTKDSGFLSQRVYWRARFPGSFWSLQDKGILWITGFDRQWISGINSISNNIKL